MEHEHGNGIIKDFERKISKKTLAREIELLNLQKILPEEKYKLIYTKANMDVVDWLIENKIADWKTLMKTISREGKEESKCIDLIRICSEQRLPVENEIQYLERKIEEFQKFESIIPEKETIKMMAAMTWPGNLRRISEACLLLTLENLLDNTKRKNALYTIKSKENKYCRICKKSNHNTENCKFKNLKIENNSQNNA